MKALWFSGGKDSTATLLLLREQLKDIYVLFCNTGRSYPEYLKTLDYAKSISPNFIEVKSVREGQWKKHGYPSDMVPVDWTLDGQRIHTQKPVMIQSYIQCCWENITIPLWKKTKELGCDIVIRGQRNDEVRRSPGRHGDTLDGVTFEHPIEHWTRDDVLDYLKEQLGELTDNMFLQSSSMDCYDCTAYSEISEDRAKYMKAKFPEMYGEYIQGVRQVYEAMSVPMKHYQRILEA